jgi:hypothetical protein
MSSIASMTSAGHESMEAMTSTTEAMEAMLEAITFGPQAQMEATEAMEAMIPRRSEILRGRCRRRT